MAVRTYRAWARDLAPTWLRGSWGGSLVECIGFIFDTIQEANYEAGAADCLEAPTFPGGEALALKGSERSIERYPAESDAAYKARVKGAWEAWPQAGTDGGLLSQLSAGTFTAALKEMRDWDWDGVAANWSRFWTIITDHGWVRTHWGDGRTWGAGTWGSTASQAEAQTLLRIIRKWKPAHTVPITIVVMEPVTWAAEQPDGTWGDPANRSTGALYHYER
jgi:hypothetical protein